jgi:hypothetical protein
VSKARLVITAVIVEGRSQAEAARAYGVSKGWVSKLIARYRAEGELAFEPRLVAVLVPPDVAKAGLRALGREPDLNEVKTPRRLPIRAFFRDGLLNQPASEPCLHKATVRGPYLAGHVLRDRESVLWVLDDALSVAYEHVDNTVYIADAVDVVVQGERS